MLAVLGGRRASTGNWHQGERRLPPRLRRPGSRRGDGVQEGCHSPWSEHQHGPVRVLAVRSPTALELRTATSTHWFWFSGG